MRGSNTVWRALAAARVRNVAAAGEAAPVPGAPGATRRALLKGLVAAGAAAALPRPALPAPMAAAAWRSSAAASPG